MGRFTEVHDWSVERSPGSMLSAAPESNAADTCLESSAEDEADVFVGH